jgi:hypothetical protein
MLRSLAVLLAMAAALSACKSRKPKEPDEFANLGRSNASSEPPAGVLAPISDGDLAAIARRGRLLFDMDRALRMAREQGLARIGEPKDDVILPVVDVDPGGKSAQVVFLRWSKQAVAKRGQLSADDAQRWLLISMLLEPEKVLDVEVRQGTIVRHTAEHVHGGAIVEAAKELERIAPGKSFSMLSVFEQSDGPTGLVTRVYAFSGEGEGPDVEVVVVPGKGKRGTPSVREWRTIHAVGAVEPGQVTLDDLDHPSAMTVMRAMSMGPDAGPVLVQTRGGPWRVMPASGRVARDDG